VVLATPTGCIFRLDEQRQGANHAEKGIHSALRISLSSMGPVRYSPASADYSRSVI
jgi:hypothetical protein